MKKLALIAALAMTFASQAFAQSYDHDAGSGNIVNPVQAEGTNGQFGVGTGAYDSGSYDAAPYASPRHVRRAQKMQMN
jgi:opacity protein-like surface antigen